MKEFLEGSMAIAKAVQTCKPGVISAYPITPQTHIVEELATMVADGHLNAQFVNVESEHSAASVVLGASATGVRTFTATSSQGLLYMAEVIFNIAGMRLPVIMACANRAISAPINIWNDHQDSITVRDAGWIQMYAETNQEAADLILQAYRIGEDHNVMLPVMVCVDGYTLTHALEVVDFPTQEEVDRFVPAFKPVFWLDPKDPMTLGPLAEPSCYMETRYAIHKTMLDAVEIIPQVSAEFKKMFGRDSGGLLKGYRLEDAESAIVAMGSQVGAVCEVVDELRDAGQRVGAMKLVTHRPFPYAAVYNALKHLKEVAILEKAISLGAEGPLFSDVKAAFYGKDKAPKLSGFVIGLGGRDVTKNSIRKVYKQLAGKPVASEFIDLNMEALKANA